LFCKPIYFGLKTFKLIFHNELTKHMNKYCKSFKCEIIDCKIQDMFTKSKLAEHIIGEHQKVECDFCKKDIKKNKFEIHVTICSKQAIKENIKYCIKKIKEEYDEISAFEKKIEVLSEKINSLKNNNKELLKEKEEISKKLIEHQNTPIKKAKPQRRPSKQSNIDDYDPKTFNLSIL